ncbi:hypothetical protein [Sphingobacterium detergens]|uniref:Uncharacterized protein n=1 Tax=Sphingobacterium detergens TaxID=1145106 RepID=A0A420BH07_SPHD1|nr:hypothetical protein [Sphingobacterium detergens]RKE55979.1 hypothetical protein DFQ12_0826 [Sphingobacterium detergens]
MNWLYIFKHWGSTLLLGAVLFILSEGLGAEEAIVFALMLSAASLVFSLPTLLVYILVFYWLKKKNRMDRKWVRLILVSTTILGIGITLFWVNFIGIMQPLICYSIAAIVSSYFFDIEKG